MDAHPAPSEKHILIAMRCYGTECITVRRERGAVDLIDDFLVNEEFADGTVESL